MSRGARWSAPLDLLTEHGRPDVDRRGRGERHPAAGRAGDPGGGRRRFVRTGRRAFAAVCAIGAIGVLVTDRDILAEAPARFEEVGVAVTTV